MCRKVASYQATCAIALRSQLVVSVWQPLGNLVTTIVTGFSCGKMLKKNSIQSLATSLYFILFISLWKTQESYCPIFTHVGTISLLDQYYLRDVVCEMNPLARVLISVVPILIQHLFILFLLSSFFCRNDFPTVGLIKGILSRLILSCQLAPHLSTWVMSTTSQM